MDRTAAQALGRALMGLPIITADERLAETRGDKGP